MATPLPRIRVVVLALCLGWSAVDATADERDPIAAAWSWALQASDSAAHPFDRW